MAIATVQVLKYDIKDITQKEYEIILLGLDSLIPESFVVDSEYDLVIELKNTLENNLVKDIKD